jgi:hypothetical protein
MSAKILQVVKPTNNLYNIYVGGWILEKDKESKEIFLDEVKSEGLLFPQDIEELAKEFSCHRIGLLEQIHVFALALVERGKKTAVEPLHLIKGQLVLSDEVEGYLGLLGAGEPDEDLFKVEYKIKALEALRDG